MLSARGGRGSAPAPQPQSSRRVVSGVILPAAGVGLPGSFPSLEGPSAPWAALVPSKSWGEGGTAWDPQRQVPQFGKTEPPAASRGRAAFWSLSCHGARAPHTPRRKSRGGLTPADAGEPLTSPRPRAAPSVDHWWPTPSLALGLHFALIKTFLALTVK